MANKNSLLRLTAQAYNTPHLLLPSSLDTILSYLELRNAGLATNKPDDEDAEESSADVVDSVGYINVSGALTYKPVVGMCGEVRGCSYTGLLSQVEELAEAGVSTIVMEFNTPGGQASHIWEYSKEIRDICDANNIELIGYAQEMATSAGYALLCMCDEVIANPDAIVGSIGCVVCLADTSKAMDMMGLKRVFITSGSAKVPFAEDGSFKQEFLAKVQTEVDRMNTQFAEHVSAYTGLSVDTVKGLNADTFNAKEALEIGLINSVMTNNEFAAYVAAKHKAKQTGAM